MPDSTTGPKGSGPPGELRLYEQRRDVESRRTAEDYLAEREGMNVGVIAISSSRLRA
jgi:hypothetical protein